MLDIQNILPEIAFADCVEFLVDQFELFGKIQVGDFFVCSYYLLSFYLLYGCLELFGCLCWIA